MKICGTNQLARRWHIGLVFQRCGRSCTSYSTTLPRQSSMIVFNAAYCLGGLWERTLLRENGIHNDNIIFSKPLGGWMKACAKDVGR